MCAPPAAFLQAYSHAVAGVPYSKTADGKTATNCCIAVEATIMDWKADQLVDYDGRHKDFMVGDGEKPWSTVTAIANLQIGGIQGFYDTKNKKHNIPKLPGVYVCQGWDDSITTDGDPLEGGHTFFIWIGEDGSTWTYEATNAKVRWARPIDIQDRFEDFDTGVLWIRVND